MRFRIVVTLLVGATLLSPAWAQEADESRLIETLRSDAAVPEKDAACRRLKEIGTEKAVPALAACLSDKDLSHAARQVLQAMSCPEAGDALLVALTKTSGLDRVGVIDSLGMRRETKAIPALTGLLSDPDSPTATAAARSLGRIGTKEAARSLDKALAKAPAEVRAAIVDGLLRAASQLHKDGHNGPSKRIARRLYNDTSLSEDVRMAAYRAWIVAAGRSGLPLVTRGLMGEDTAARQASLSLAAELPGDRVTKAVVDTLGRTSPPVQVALLAALNLRADSAACPAVLQAAQFSDPAVRLAALSTLANVGDQTAAPVLADLAANAGATEQKAARQTLGMLHHGDVHKVMLDLLGKSESKIQVELIKALAVRRDKEAVPALLALTEATDESVQMAAARAIGALGDEPCASHLIAMLQKTKSDTSRDAVGDAIVEIAGNIEKNDDLVAKLLAIDTTAPVPVRMTALRAAARLRPDLALPALQTGVRSDDPEMRRGALRALSEFAGVAALDDLLALARDASDDTERTIALRGYWRLVALTMDRPANERLDLIRAGLAQARSADDKKGGLSMLASMATKEALECAEQACRDEAVRSEAEAASYQIATRVFIVERPVAERVLRRLAAEAKDEGVRNNASGFKATLDANADYVVPWLVSQPYRIEGKDAGALFDIPLGPELPDGGGVVWNKMPAPSDSAKFRMVDLGSVVGGDNCVVYLKTQVFWPKNEDVELQMGSDDGIKLWVNGTLVHANNAIRGFTADQDKATARLTKGWNSFQAKISQYCAGCSMAVRLRPPGATAPQPLKVEAR